MKFEELLNELKAFEGTAEFNSYIAGHMTDDGVKQYLTTDNGKKMLQPQLDSYFNKGLESWKNNNLNGLVDAEVKKRFPEQDPKDIALSAVKAELDKMKADMVRKDLTIKAQAFATEKKLPMDLIDYFIGVDEKATNENLEKFAQIFTTSLSTAVDEKMKGASHVPPEGDDKTSVDGVTAAFMKNNPGLKIIE